MCSNHDIREVDYIFFSCVFELKATKPIDGHLKESVLCSFDGHLKLKQNSPQNQQLYKEREPLGHPGLTLAKVKGTPGYQALTRKI